MEFLKATSTTNDIPNCYSTYKCIRHNMNLDYMPRTNALGNNRRMKNIANIAIIEEFKIYYFHSWYFAGRDNDFIPCGASTCSWIDPIFCSSILFLKLCWLIYYHTQYVHELQGLMKICLYSPVRKGVFSHANIQVYWFYGYWVMLLHEK